MCLTDICPCRALETKANVRNLSSVLIGEGRIMAKSIVIAALLFSAGVGVSAYGQDNGLTAPELSKPAPGQLLDQDYLAPTGATVPRPGVPQASGPTALD